MSKSRLQFMKEVGDVYRDHPVLNLHIQTEIRLLSSNVNNRICQKCGKVLCSSDEVEVKTKGRGSSLKRTRLTVKCSFCGGVARSVLMQKRPSLPKKENIVKKAVVAAPLAASKAAKKRKRGKDSNAGLIIPSSFKSSVKAPVHDSNRIMQFLQAESRSSSKGTLLDKFFK